MSEVPGHVLDDFASHVSQIQQIFLYGAAFCEMNSRTTNISLDGLE
jgi:hypothetical protein